MSLPTELMRRLRPFRAMLMMAAGLSAVVNLLMLVPTLYMMQIYDRVLVSQNSLTLLFVSLLVLALMCLMAFADALRSRVLVNASQGIDGALGSHVFRASFETRMARLNDPRRPADRGLSDLLQVRQFITGNGAFALFDLPWAPIYIGVMFVLHPALGWMSIVFTVVQAVLAWVGHQAAVAPAEQAQQALVDAQRDLQGKLQHAEAVLPMGMQPGVMLQWLQRHGQWLYLSMISHRQTHTVTAWSKFVRYTQQSLALGGGALLVVQGELSPGAMIAANVLMTRALAPVETLAGTWRSLITAWQAGLRLDELLLERRRETARLANAAPLVEPVQGELLIQDVTVTLAGREKPLLHDVSLRVSPGRVLGILGPSGSGKSTLARVMLGVWGETQGRTLFDGQDIRMLDRERLGALIGYLPQDVELFDGSIAENIARMGEVESAKVIEAAKLAGLHEIILRFPAGYDSPVGERGAMLSGGQRQRIALARAVYGNPRFVVLDEPNASLDDAGEAALNSAILALKARSCAVVLITHRQGVLGLTDELLVLHDGQVRARGPRDQVLASLRSGTTGMPPSASASA